MSANPLDIHTYGPKLPGVRGGKLKGPMARTVSGFMAALQSYRAVSDAGDYGCVMVWIDDDGKFRCHFMVRGVSRTSIAAKTKVEVRKWLKTWLPVQRKAPGQ